MSLNLPTFSQFTGVVISLALCVSVPAEAEVYKCMTPDGRIQYQDFPCTNNAKNAEKLAFGSPEVQREQETRGLVKLIERRLKGEFVATESIYSRDAKVTQFEDANCTKASMSYGFEALKRMETEVYRAQLRVASARMSSVEIVSNLPNKTTAETYLMLTFAPDNRVEEYFLKADVSFGREAPRIVRQSLCSLSAPEQKTPTKQRTPFNESI